MKRNASSVSVIGGADGPTSFFILKNRKLTARQRITRIKSKIKKFYTKKTLKCEPHSLDEVMDYIVDRYGFEKVSCDSCDYEEEKEQLRVSSIVRYAPKLLEEYAENSKLMSESREDVEAFFKYNEERIKRASEIPSAVFDIDFHKFKKIFEGTNDYMDVIIEKRFVNIGGGAVGSKKVINEYNKIYKDIYRYYGVTEEDIRTESDRYKELLGVLSQ